MFDALSCEGPASHNHFAPAGGPQWAQGLHYNKGIFSEVLVYYDDEAVYFETRGEDSSIVRFSFEMLETLKQVVEEE